MNPHHHLLRNALLFLSLHHHLLAFSSDQNLLLPSDASALLRFKSAADLRNRLNFSAKTSFAFCKWRGVECSDSRAIRIVVENMNLGGVFAPNSLSQLGELRVLSLQNNTLTGPIPSLSSLINLKVLFLSHNYFSGAVPPSISTLHRLKTVDLSFNMLAGSIPVSLNGLDRLYYLRLDFNRFNGSVPAFNQSSLQIFNVSHNDLSGAIPVTPTLSRFNETSFASNSALCGEIIHKQCRSTQPFFGLPANIAAAPPPAAALKQTAVTLSGKGGVLQKHKRAAFAIGLSLAASFFVVSILCIAVAARKRRNSSEKGGITKSGLESSVTGNAEAVMRIEEENDELAEKVKRLQEVKQQLMVVGKSGNLMFCAGESPAYTIDQLMRASAELLGRGTTGTTYKAVLDSRMIVTVKRLDGARFAAAKPEIFEGHMRSVGGLRHPNLVPLRAYFQAKEERILIYDYHANGSLSSLIHGSKSAKAKPLHWTSCLKIAEDAAQGLCYIHQAWRLVHGNLKSSNVLLGSDFEACLTDYCLVALAGPADDEEVYYTAPEVVKSGQRGAATSKSDVYSFGVLLLELLSGQHPSIGLDEMVRWMRSVRAEEGEERLEMMLEVAMACSVVSPEQRPTMWQVLKMVQEIKEVVMMEDCEFDFKPEVV